MTSSIILWFADVFSADFALSFLLHVCFGRHSGYGGYGTWGKGARVFRIEIDQNNSTFMAWSSWVRMESGEIVDRYSPS